MFPNHLSVIVACYCYSVVVFIAASLQENVMVIGDFAVVVIGLFADDE
jgi:hypothetical protein